MERAPSGKSTRVQRTKVVGSNPADPITRGTGAPLARIFKTLWELKKDGQSEDTLKAKGDRRARQLFREKTFTMEIISLQFYRI
jgi:hypothetical protein